MFLFNNNFISLILDLKKKNIPQPKIRPTGKGVGSKIFNLLTLSNEVSKCMLVDLSNMYLTLFYQKEWRGGGA